MIDIVFKFNDNGSELAAAGSIADLAIATAHFAGGLYQRIKEFNEASAEAYKTAVQEFMADEAPTWNRSGGKGTVIGFDPEELRKQMEMGK